MRSEYGAEIIQQYNGWLRARLDHERFTMDDSTPRRARGLRRALRKGYIYRDDRIVNWCPSCASAISDLEVR